MDLLTMELTRAWQVNAKMMNALALAWVEWWMDLVEPYKKAGEWKDY
jgi:hypothetical protein